jgi:hypothetical protein
VPHNEEYKLIFSMLVMVETYLRRTGRGSFADRLQEFKRDLAGDRETERKKQSKMLKCKHEGCNELVRPHKKNGLCSNHEMCWCRRCKRLVIGSQASIHRLSSKKIGNEGYRVVDWCRGCKPTWPVGGVTDSLGG